MTKIVQLQSNDWMVDIDPRGGAVRNAQWRGLDILRPYREDWDAFPPVCNASFPLVPYSNRIGEGRFVFEGGDYTVPSYRPGDRHGLHGVGWRAPWLIEELREGFVCLTYRHDGPDWPWTFEVEQRIEIAGDQLVFTMRFLNTDNRSQPVGLGFHPYFPRDDNTRLMFASRAVWDGKIAGVSERLVDLPERWRFETGRALTDEQIDHCFTGWSGPARIDWPNTGLSVEVASDQALDHVVVFTPTGEPYLCFEPVSHMSNAIHHLESRTDTGLNVLRTNESFQVSMTLTPSKS